MSFPRSLYWHQGLFLQPQHFQLLERSQESRLSSFLHVSRPHFWGVEELRVQKAALGARSFGLQQGGFLFPDGTYAVFPGNALIESRSFEFDWVEGGKPFPVYVGLRKWNDAGENVTVLPSLERMGGVTTRFVAVPEPEEVRDLHGGGPSGQIRRMYHLLKVFWETEKDQLGDYLLVPVASLERMGEEIRLSEQFVPPALAISASELLLRIVREIRDQIAARCRQLEEYKRQRGVQTAEFGTRDVAYLLALRSLNRYAPLLFHFTESSPVHPWEVYGVIRQLVGELSSFSEKVRTLGETEGGERILPLYDHRSLYRCFLDAQLLVSRLLDEITAGPEHVIRLGYDGTYFAADLPPAVFDSRNRYFLTFRTDGDPDAVRRDVETVAKLGSRESLPLLIARALPGVVLTHLSSPPQELPRRAKTQYFSVDSHGEPWGAVEQGRNVAIYWDTAPEDLEAELMVVGGA